MSEPQRRPGILQRLWSRPEPTADDAADYGTCFGLELSLSVVPTTADAPQPWQLRWMRHLATRTRRQT
jgi:hypothetical protein